MNDVINTINSAKSQLTFFGVVVALAVIALIVSFAAKKLSKSKKYMIRAQAGVAVLAARVATNFGATLRRRLFAKVQSFSMEEINSFSTASLITRSTNDVVQVQMLIVLSMQVVIKAPAMAIWAITKIAGKAWQWSLATGIAIVLLVGFLAIAMVLTFPKFRKIQR